MPTKNSNKPANRTQFVPAHSTEATARKLDFEDETQESSQVEPVLNGSTLTEKQAEIQETIARLEDKRDEYVERLDLGATKIENARQQGKDVTIWEDYWIQLLHQYEAVCDKLRDLYIEM